MAHMPSNRAQGWHLAKTEDRGCPPGRSRHWKLADFASACTIQAHSALPRFPFIFPLSWIPHLSHREWKMVRVTTPHFSGEGLIDTMKRSQLGLPWPLKRPALAVHLQCSKGQVLRHRGMCGYPRTPLLPPRPSTSMLSLPSAHQEAQL